MGAFTFAGSTRSGQLGRNESRSPLRIGARVRTRQSCILMDGLQPAHRGEALMARRFLMNAGRTSKQGQQINVGKDYAEYQAIVNTMTMHADDMKELGIPSGATVRVWNEYGEANFLCKEGKIPSGMIFVPY